MPGKSRHRPTRSVRCLLQGFDRVNNTFGLGTPVEGSDFARPNNTTRLGLKYELGNYVLLTLQPTAGYYHVEKKLLPDPSQFKSTAFRTHYAIT
jgi:hypothetical protein